MATVAPKQVFVADLSAREVAHEDECIRHAAQKLQILSLESFHFKHVFTSSHSSTAFNCGLLSSLPQDETGHS
jgi:hypothetical protein